MKPRKKYRHDPGRKYDNPLLRRVEANTLERWRVEHFKIIDGKQQGEDSRRLIEVLAEVIAPAIKSIEGFDDPDGVGDVMADAMMALAAMVNASNGWDVGQNDLIKEAIGYAIQVTNGVPVATLARCVLWTRSVAAGLPA